MANLSLLEELRKRIKDTRYSVRGLSVVVSDSAVTSAIAEVTNGHLIISVSGGTAPSIDFDLTNPRFNTVGKLFDVLSRVNGYAAHIDEDAETDHDCVDLSPVGPIDIRSNGIELRHRLFSDAELESICNQACSRHNPSFSPLTVPLNERVFVLQLAHAIVLREQAADAAKRKGLDSTVKDLLRIADSYEKAYQDDTQRLKRALVSPKEADPNTMGEGDVVIGNLFRSSLRTGYRSPLGQNLPPSPAVLMDPDVYQDIEDDAAIIRWKRNRDNNFYSYELWIDNRPEVKRTREGITFAGAAAGFSEITGDIISTSTSKLAFRSLGANSNTSGASFATFVEEFGQGITSFRIGQLESDTEYYFRLYIIDLNYEAVSSNVIRVVTKPLRARFAANNYLSTLSGASGATVTLTFDSSKGEITTDHVFRIGGKVAALTVLTPYTATFVVPSFQNLGNKDISVQSPTGLVDVRANVFNVIQ